MKKLVFAALSITLGLALISCGGAKGDNPGHAYMPDMYYARAYETYGYNNVQGEYDSLRKRGINYSGLLVPGSIAREDMLPYHLTGDSAGMLSAGGMINPLDTLSKDPKIMKEAERLYLINCGICHGSALDGNGPLWKGGEGPFPAAPRPLNAEYAKDLTDGSYFHTITFGKGAMGSYASQLRPEQRWMVISYIRNKQAGAAIDSASVTTPSAATVAGGDTTTQQP